MNEEEYEVKHPGTRRSKLWYWKSEANRQKSLSRNARYIAKRLSEGKCRSCGSDEIINQPYCDECLKKERERRKKLQIEKILASECLSCSKPAKQDKSRCDRCLKKQRDKQTQRRRLKGVKPRSNS